MNRDQILCPPEILGFAQRWVRHNLGDEWNRRDSDGEILPPMVWTTEGWEEVAPLSEPEAQELFPWVRGRMDQDGQAIKFVDFLRMAEDIANIFVIDVEYAMWLCDAARIQG